jgi:hypothetical protein
MLDCLMEELYNVRPSIRISLQASLPADSLFIVITLALSALVQVSRFAMFSASKVGVAVGTAHYYRAGTPLLHITRKSSPALVVHRYKREGSNQ